VEKVKSTHAAEPWWGFPYPGRFARRVVQTDGHKTTRPRTWSEILDEVEARLDFSNECSISQGTAEATPQVLEERYANRLPGIPTGEVDIEGAGSANP